MDPITEDKDPAPETQPGFGAWLRRHRVERGITRQVLADTANKKWVTVREVEDGRACTDDTRAALLAALDAAPRGRGHG